MQWWEKPYAAMRERQNKIWLRYWTDMKAKIENGTAPECFGRQFVEAGYSKKGIDELQAAFIAGSKCVLRPTTTHDRSLEDNVVCVFKEICLAVANPIPS
jgi:hypothetical protein